MQLIKNWLNGHRNFTVGLHLYNLYGDDNGLKNLFDSIGETPFTKQKMEQGLQAICDTRKRPPEPIQESVLKQMPAGDTDILKSIEKEWKPLYKQMVFKQHQMQAYGKDNSTETRTACKELANEILSLEQQVMRIWDKRTYYEKHGRLPDIEEEQDKTPTDPVSLGAFIESCKRNIRRAKNNMINHPGKPIYVQLHIDWKARYKKATGNDYKEKN
ncbi:MAG: hypothetical protein M0Q26_05880 [Chitinophagaceae bacterium]|nr:hypothetical protein [Chitinophagaceae bacterium]MDP1763412.1 hypothetical protein [Sediminibacterium sp.]